MRAPNVPLPVCRTVRASPPSLTILPAALVVSVLVALVACSDPLAYAEAWDLRGSVSHTSGEAETISARIVMVNRVSRTLQAHASAHCPPVVNVQALHAGHPGGAAMWDYRRQYGGWACVAMAIPPVDVAPGDSVVYEVEFLVTDVLGDSLQVGPYAFRGVMLGMGELDDGSYRTVELGTLTLGVRPEA